MTIINHINRLLNGSNSLIGLFVIVLLGSLTTLVYSHSLQDVLGCLGMSALIAAVFIAVVGIIPNRFFLSKSAFCIVALLLGVLSAIDLFVFFNFGKPFDQDVMDIVCDTNPDEVSAFVDTYFSWWQAILVLVCISGLCYGVYRVLRTLRPGIRKAINIVILALAVVGAGYLAAGAYSYVRYGNGLAIPQYSNLTRVLHDIHIVRGRIDAIKSLTALCADVQAANISGQPDSTLYVVIIGESLSKYHCSLYGYGLKTNPKLEQRRDRGELCVFDDAVCIDDHTHTVMKSIFSFARGNEGFESQPLFPAVFRKAGYNTSLYDNQYFVDRGVSFLNDRELSDIMFDYRNSVGYGYDGEMLEDITVPDGPALVVVHLMGQHYTYADRYPESYSTFTPDQYQEYKDEYRAIIAHYDNSVRYNDSIIDSFLERLSNRHCCVLYFTDHGEEVYEYGDFMGHGNAAHSTGLELQIRVPLVIWGSDSFRRSDNWNNILTAAKRKVTTDDIAHTLTDLAGIQTEAFAPRRSFVNDNYVETHRTVLKTIDIDAAH